MTEGQWLTEREPRALLAFAIPRPRQHCIVWRCHPRTMRLFAVAACRALPDGILDDQAEQILADTERFADATTNDERKLIRRARAILHPRASASLVTENGWHVGYNHPAVLPLIHTTSRNVMIHARSLMTACFDVWNQRQHPGGIAARYADLLRDILGNPFQPRPVFNRRWRSSSALALARTMYDARDFAALPILADALEEAGCDDAGILTHCRDPNLTHVRGCWVVDLVLGKS